MTEDMTQAAAQVAGEAAEAVQGMPPLKPFSRELNGLITALVQGKAPQAVLITAADDGGVRVTSLHCTFRDAVALLAVANHATLSACAPSVATTGLSEPQASEGASPALKGDQ